MNTDLKVFLALSRICKKVRGIPNPICVLMLPLVLLSVMAGCGGSNNSDNNFEIEDANQLSPPPARFSFRGQDDPVGFVPEATSQAPNPPLSSYNPDGTRV